MKYPEQLNLYDKKQISCCPYWRGKEEMGGRRVNAKGYGISFAGGEKLIVAMVT